MSLVRSLSAALVFGAALAVPPCHAQHDSAPADSAKVATIHRLLDLMKTPANMSSMFDATIAAQRSSLPGVPAAMWDAISARAHASIPQLVDSLVPIYSRHLTHQELEQVVQVYSSPVRQRLVDPQQVRGLLLRQSVVGVRAYVVTVLAGVLDRRLQPLHRVGVADHPGGAVLRLVHRRRQRARGLHLAACARRD